MFKLLKTVFKAGDVTTKYPFKPYEVDEDFRGKPELNSDQCVDHENRSGDRRPYMVIISWSLYFLWSL